MLAPDEAGDGKDEDAVATVLVREIKGLAIDNEFFLLGDLGIRFAAFTIFKFSESDCVKTLSI